jgi:thioredoxin-like negative regulator of GroEL
MLIRIGAAACLLTAMSASPLPAVDDASGWTMVEDVQGLDGFLAARRAADEPALIILGVRGCPPCREIYGMVAELPPELQRRVVGARIEESPDIAERFPMGGLPWLIAVGGDGTQVPGVYVEGAEDIARLLSATTARAP